MIADLKPYPAVKDSGVEWLGDVPESWEVRRLKTLFHEVDERTETGAETLLSLRMEQGLVPHESVSNQPISTSDLVGYKSVSPGQLVMNRMRAAIGVFGVPKQAGLVSPDYAVFDPVHDVEPSYFLRLFKSSRMCSEFRIASKGLGTGSSGFMRLYTDQFGIIRVPYPPLPEQAAIVRYLQHVDWRVRRLVRAKRKLIALFKEQKQTIIHRAVTRGLDPNVPLRNSGVEWLGEVPEHWEVIPLRRVTISRCDGPFGSGLKSSHYSDDGVRVVRLQNIGYGEFNDTGAAYIGKDYYATLGDHSVNGGDILIAGLGDERRPAGRACVAPQSICPAMVKADCFRFRLDRDRCVPKFLALQLSSTATVASAVLSRGATRQRTNLQLTGSREVAIPSPVEQSGIIEHIVETTANIDAAIDRVDREIALLIEYRTRLIADVVTGKLDVREAAVVLDDVDPPYAEDKLDGIEADGEARLDELDVFPEETEA